MGQRMQVSDQTRPLRRPLTDSAGNIKYPILASSGYYNDQKGSLQSLDKKIPCCAGRDDLCANCEMGFGVNCLYQPQNRGIGYDSGTLGGYGMDMGRGYGIGAERASHSQFTLPSQRIGRIRRKAVGGRKTKNPILDSVCVTHV